MPVNGIRTVSTTLVRCPRFPGSPSLPSCTPHHHTPANPPPQNGAAAYVPPTTSLSLHYCDWAGSSRGMTAFLRSPLLTRLTASHPHVEFKISPRPGRHPVLKAYYVTGREKAVCVRNMRIEEIESKVKALLGNDGTKNKRLGARKVLAVNESVRGVWSPMHGGLRDV